MCGKTIYLKKSNLNYWIVFCNYWN
jgi:hypothetical protein